MTTMTDRDRRRNLLNEAASGNPLVKRELLGLYRRWRKGEVAEFDNAKLRPGVPVRITNRDSSYYMYIGQIVEVHGQAGETPVKVQIRENGRFVELWFEVTEVLPLQDED